VVVQERLDLVGHLELQVLLVQADQAERQDHQGHLEQVVLLEPVEVQELLVRLVPLEIDIQQILHL
jgi:hypothetical protein